MDQRGSTRRKGGTKTVVKLSNDIKLTRKMCRQTTIQFGNGRDGKGCPASLSGLSLSPTTTPAQEEQGNYHSPLPLYIHAICTCACALSRVDERVFVLQSFSRRVVLIADSRRKLEARGVQC